MRQVGLHFPVHLEESVILPAKRAKTADENVDCEMYNLTNVMKFTPQDTGKASTFQP